MFIVSGFSNFKHKFLPSFDVLWMTGTELYIAPWTRITPYIVGVACGYFLKKKRKTFTASDVRQIKENWPWQRDTYYSLFLRFFPFFLSIAPAKFFVLHFDILDASCASLHDLPRYGYNLSVCFHYNWPAIDRDRSQYIYHHECMWLWLWVNLFFCN